MYEAMHYTITLWVLYVGQAAAVNSVSVPSSQTEVRELFRKAHHKGNDITTELLSSSILPKGNRSFADRRLVIILPAVAKQMLVWNATATLEREAGSCREIMRDSAIWVTIGLTVILTDAKVSI